MAESECAELTYLPRSLDLDWPVRCFCRWTSHLLGSRFQCMTECQNPSKLSANNWSFLTSRLALKLVMGCTCQTPACVVPRLTLWLLIIVSRFQLGHSNGVTLLRWEPARECSSQPYYRVTTGNFSPKTFIKQRIFHVDTKGSEMYLYLFQYSANAQNIDFSIHSTWDSAVIQSELTADEWKQLALHQTKAATSFFPPRFSNWELTEWTGGNVPRRSI